MGGAGTDVYVFFDGEKQISIVKIIFDGGRGDEKRNYRRINWGRGKKKSDSLFFFFPSFEFFYFYFFGNRNTNSFRRAESSKMWFLDSVLVGLGVLVMGRVILCLCPAR